LHNEIKKWNDYQATQIKTTTTPATTTPTTTTTTTQTTAKKIETYFLPIPDIFKFYMNNMYQDFIYICESTASQVSDSVIEVIESDAYDLMTETEEIIKNHYKQVREETAPTETAIEEGFDTSGFASSISDLISVVLRASSLVL